MSHNTWIHKFARLTVVRPLASTGVTPNQVTTVRLAAGLTAAGMLAIGGAPMSSIAAGVFVLAMVLDRADGDLARMTGRTSPGGHVFDLVSDAVSNSLVFVGLGIGLRAGSYGYGAIAMGCLAGAAVAAILWLVVKIEELEGERAAELGGVGGFDPDDAMLIVPIVIWAGGAEPLLLAAAAGAPAFAIFFYWFFRRQLTKIRGK